MSVLQRPNLKAVGDAFANTVNTDEEFVAAIRAYSSFRISHVRGLKDLLSHAEEGSPGYGFFQITLPNIVAWALRLDSLCPDLPILTEGPDMLKLSNGQCASLLANMFLCSFPEPPDGLDMPPCQMFGGLLQTSAPQETAKLRMFIRYFEQIGAPGSTPMQGHLYIRRCSLPFKDLTTERWLGSKQPMLSMEVLKAGVIEDAVGYLQVDFANEYIGGGVLCGGCVQEEIRYWFQFHT